MLSGPRVLKASPFVSVAETEEAQLKHKDLPAFVCFPILALGGGVQMSSADPSW